MSAVQASELTLLTQSGHPIGEVDHPGAVVRNNGPATACALAVDADLYQQVRWLHARDVLIDTETWRVELQDCFPVVHFGARFDVTTPERFSFEPNANAIE